VRLGELPDNATDEMKKVAEDIAFLIGLFASAGENRPLPYSCRFGAERIGSDKASVNRALKALVKANVILCPGQLTPHGSQENGKPNSIGTFAYAAPIDLLPAEKPVATAPAIKDRVEPDGPWSIDEGEEVRDDVPVGQAIADDRGEVLEGDDWVIAPGDAATLFGHGENYNAGDCRNSFDEELR
jgi:hypothetical protein